MTWDRVTRYSHVARAANPLCAIPDDLTADEARAARYTLEAKDTHTFADGVRSRKLGELMR
jgi:hypothetical protein